MSFPIKEKFYMKGNQYYCYYCDKEFKSYHGIGGHLRVHNPETMLKKRPYYESLSSKGITINNLLYFNFLQKHMIEFHTLF